MVRSSSKFKAICKRKRNRRGFSSSAGPKVGGSYEKMMKTLLLQNQQIIIQQQNMMFMVMKQYQQPQGSSQPTTSAQAANGNLSNLVIPTQTIASQPISSSQSSTVLVPTSTASNNIHHHHEQQQPLQQHHQNQVQDQQMQQLQTQLHNIVHHDEHSIQTHHLFSQADSQRQHQATNLQDTQQQIQTRQQLNHVDQQQMQENVCNYLTPAASEQDPIRSDDEAELAALLQGDDLLHNNVLYNPQTDIGTITPYKNQQQQHQTPSYYSSGCESLTTPRVEHQRQPTTVNISQNVVKNLSASFKSPTKPKINVQILSNSSTGSMKNSKAKIIQRMNISEFLRHVHPEAPDETKKSISQ